MPNPRQRADLAANAGEEQLRRHPQGLQRHDLVARQMDGSINHPHAPRPEPIGDAEGSDLRRYLLTGRHGLGELR
ncbi:MAG: hypothetical protein HYV63_14480 [Candidatus Schekmanbacteria bacterium]|nr:hypothetical protein [Candidatus Schekmanbacteria bacterium]